MSTSDEAVRDYAARMPDTFGTYIGNVAKRACKLRDAGDDDPIRTAFGLTVVPAGFPFAGEPSQLEIDLVSILIQR